MSSSCLAPLPPPFVLCRGAQWYRIILICAETKPRTAVPLSCHVQQVWIFNNMNVSKCIDSTCVQALQHNGTEWQCIFAEHTSPFITTPMFALQSQYDSWQVHRPYAPAGTHPDYNATVCTDKRCALSPQDVCPNDRLVHYRMRVRSFM
jgi:hypothetical protein